MLVKTLAYYNSLKHITFNYNCVNVSLFFFLRFVSLKKTISIFFLLIFLTSNTEAHQLLKLPLLVHHYTEHKKQNKKISFADFINMHYVMADDGDGDTTEDMKLPFKSDTACESICSLGFVSNSNYQMSVKIFPSEIKLFKNHPLEFISSSFLSAIWQPPKF
jgi:hypothetical protein